MKKLLLLLCLVFSLVFVSCNTNPITPPNPPEEKQYFVVKYNVSDGTVVSENDVQVELYDLYYLVTPTKTDSLFLGWFRDSSHTDGPVTEIIGEEEKTYRFYAKWYTPDEDDLNTINSIVDRINNLPNPLSFSDYDTVMGLYIEYSNLDEYNQKMVTNHDKLLKALKDVEDEVEKERIVQSHVKVANSKLDSLLDVKIALLDEEKILSVKEYIDTLNERELSLLNLKRYNKLVEECASQRQIVDITNNLIEKIPNVIDRTSFDAVNAARNAYDKVPTDLKKDFIKNANKLLEAELALKNLPKEATDVIALINLIPDEVSIYDNQTIVTARTEYDKLPAGDKAKVTNYQKLVDAEATYNNLLEEARNADKIASELVSLIQSIRYQVKLEDEALILDCENKYNHLSSALKERIYNYQLVVFAKERLNKLKNNKDKIQYVLGDEVYASISDLTSAYYGDFFNFIYSQPNGYDQLVSIGRRTNQACGKNYDITTPEGFIAAAYDWDWDTRTTSRGEGQRGLADGFSNYYVAKDSNGVPSNQPETTFLGYCSKHQWHVEFNKVMYRFFMYWRTDESCARFGDNLADVYAQPWAALVDCCKFFHFAMVDDEYHFLDCYRRSERLMDIFNFTTGVVYGTLPTTFTGSITLPTNLRLRGYNFVGFYDNPEFKGSPITKLTDDTKNYKLYAKFEIDPVSYGKEKAAYVDAYIYCLKSSYSQTNAHYTKEMYEALTDEEKSYIKFKDYYNSMFK